MISAQLCSFDPSATALAVYEGGFNSGETAIAAHARGRGRVITIGCQCPAPVLQSIYALKGAGREGWRVGRDRVRGDQNS